MQSVALGKEEMLRHKKMIVVFVVLCSLSLLVAWDLYTLRRGAAAITPMADIASDAASDNEGKDEKRTGRAKMMFRSPSRGEVDDESSPQIARIMDVPVLYGNNKEIRPATKVAAFQKEAPSSSRPDFYNGNQLKRHPLQANLGAILNLTHSSSEPPRESGVDVIKKLLLNNETESARALWVKAQQQHLSKTVASTTESRVSQGQGGSLDGGENKRLFHVQSSLSWPVPHFTRSDILQSRWVQELMSYLETITVWRQISVVTANLEHQEVVLNWLVSAVTVAKLPLKKILVLSLSLQLHDLLTSKKVNSVYIPPASVISKAGLKRITTAFNQIHIVRLTLFRLMNHWKYDVVMYDSDAVVLKDPQSLFDSYPGVELVGSAGKGPESIGHIWGRTICTGVLLMRTSPALESWWEKMSQVARLPFTDQGLVNLALKSLHVQWDQPSPLHLNRDMRGSCQDTKLRAVVLSEEKICRYSCDSRKKGEYYVWHKPAIKRNRTVENKKKMAREGGAWFLREDWAEVSKMSSLTGVSWLLAISHNT